MKRLADDPGACRELLEQSLDMLTVVDAGGAIIFNTPAIERVLGYRPEDLLGSNVLKYIHPDDLPAIEAVIGRLLAGEADFESHQYRFRHKNGNYRWIASVARIWDRAGVRGLLVSSRDVTDLQATVERLEQTNELLGKVFSASTNLLSITRPDTGVYIDVNDAWCRTFGYAREEVIGRSSLDLDIWEDPGQRQAVVAELEARGRLRGRNAVVRTRRGELRELIIDAEILTVSGERRYLMACTDVTEARRVEAELRQAQKMEAIGQLTGGIAHDFNNLLGVILGNAELLALRLADQPDVEQLVTPIQRACERGAALTRQLLAFARRQALVPQSVRLDELVQRLEPVLSTTLTKNTRISIDAAPDLWPCTVDAGQLENALLNLALNARDAMPAGGEFRIRVENRRVARDGGDSRVGDYVALMVSDSGTGIEPEIAEHVFEPFFTTKGPGHGTGLGLSMVSGFVSQSGGSVELQSEPGRGTTVTLLLPRAADQPADPGAPPRGVPRARGETVLLVEDNDPLRALLAEQLRGLGYAVFEARDEEAVGGVLASGIGLDLVVSDITLAGGKRGPEIVRDVRAARPQAAVLLMSGHPAADAPDHEYPLIGKPFSRDQFANAVRQAINGRAAAS